MRTQETMYYVVWMNKSTGQQGRGKSPLNLKTAQAWADMMNAEFPEIRHWVEPAKDSE